MLLLLHLLQLFSWFAIDSCLFIYFFFKYHLLQAPQGKNEVSAPTAIVKPADKQQQRMAERELQRAQLVAAKAEQKRLAQQRLLEKKEAMLQKKQQAASEKAEKEQTEASAAHYQHLKAELDRIKMELLAYREAKRAGALDAPTGYVMEEETRDDRWEMRVEK